MQAHLLMELEKTSENKTKQKAVTREIGKEPEKYFTKSEGSCKHDNRVMAYKCLV